MWKAASRMQDTETWEGYENTVINAKCLKDRVDIQKIRSRNGKTNEKIKCRKWIIRISSKRVEDETWEDELQE